MNMDSYEILRECEQFINTNDSIRFKAKFTCPDESFQFELTSKLTGNVCFFAIWTNDINNDDTEKAAQVIMAGLGYERIDN